MALDVWKIADKLRRRIRRQETTIGAVATLLFLGGWLPPFPEPYSDFIPILVFVIGGLIAIYHGLNPARRMDKYTLPVTGL